MIIIEPIINIIEEHQKTPLQTNLQFSTIKSKYQQDYSQNLTRDFHYHPLKYNESSKKWRQHIIRNNSGIDKQNKPYRTQTDITGHYIAEVAFKPEGKEEIIQQGC